MACGVMLLPRWACIPDYGYHTHCSGDDVHVAHAAEYTGNSSSLQWALDFHVLEEYNLHIVAVNVAVAVDDR